MQRALGYEGQGVLTIFERQQLDVGAPPQFLDFRFTVHDRLSGTEEALTLRVVQGEPSEESSDSDVGLFRFSKGAGLAFGKRSSLPWPSCPGERGLQHR
jgi:hypothetical protein